MVLGGCHASRMGHAQVDKNTNSGHDLKTGGHLGYTNAVPKISTRKPVRTHANT